jgi:hypothetical protein
MQKASSNFHDDIGDKLVGGRGLFVNIHENYNRKKLETKIIRNHVSMKEIKECNLNEMFVSFHL